MYRRHTDLARFSVESVIVGGFLEGCLVEAIAIRVGDLPTLVVVDNCEHVLDAVANLADTLLRRCESLMTSAARQSGFSISRA